MVGHAQQTVDRYLELTQLTVDSLKYVATPCIDDHMLPPEDFVNKGHLAAEASKAADQPAEPEPYELKASRFLLLEE